MSLWRHLTRGLRSLTQRDRIGRELDDEVRDFYERAYADLIDDGLSPAEARSAAQRALGGPDRAREDLADYGWENVVEGALGDARYAARRLRMSPSFTAVAVMTLALGIGACTAILSAVFPILIEPLPYPDAGRLVQLIDRDGNGAPLDVTYGTYLEVAARNRSFESLAVADRWQPSIVGEGNSERVLGDYVSASYFRVLGVAPALGRDFRDSDDVPGARRVAILTSGLAARRFGTALQALDQTIRLDGQNYEVVGIMPADYENALAPDAAIWSPRQFRADAPFQSTEWGHHLRMIARLEPGASVDSAREELAALGANLIDEFPRPPWALFQSGLDVEPLQQAMTATARPVLLAVLGAVTLLLLIACANVTNLLLARNVRRRGELAVRAALGAGRARLVRQLLTESSLLAALAGMIAVPIALIGIDGIVALAPPDLPRADAIGFDVSAFIGVLGITAIVGIGVGLIPALRQTRPDLRVDLHAGARSAGGAHNTVRRGLIVLEVALAVMLLVGAGLLYRSVAALLSTPTGFDASRVLTMQVISTSDRNRSADETRAYFDQVLDAVRASPGVASAAFTSQLPLGGGFEGYGVVFEATGDEFPGNVSSALRYSVTPDYFRVMGIPLVDGRLLDDRDQPGAPDAILLNESFANLRFPNGNAIGQRLRIGPDIDDTERPWRRVVGVVGDVKHASLALGPPAAFYVAIGQWPWVDYVQSLIVRTDSDPVALIPSVRNAALAVDSTSVVARVETMQDLSLASEAARRFTLTLFAIFAAAALALAALGIYGVMAGSVEERTREIGLRSALGASPASLLSLFVRQGLTLTAIGVGVGVVLAVAATRGLRSMLFEVTSLDPPTYGVVIGLIALVAIVACSLPARRASRVDPTVALRAE